MAQLVEQLLRKLFLDDLELFKVIQDEASGAIISSRLFNMVNAI